MKNRFSNLFLLLTAALMVLLAPFGTAQGREDPHDVFEYDEVDGKAVITRYNGSEQQVTIPGEIDGYTVVAIGRGAFYCAEYITGVTIPGSVREIEDEAFRGCSNLSTVKFANGLVSIDYYAFADTNLSHVRLPDSLKTLSSSAFLHCSNLQKVHLPKGLDDIGNSVFWGCGSSLVLSVYNGSPGHQYALDHNINCIILTESINMPDVSAVPGETFVIKPTVLPVNASVSDFDWTNSAPDVVQMSSPGNLKGLKPGTATITVKAKDGSGVSGSCMVTVTVPVTGISLTPSPASVEKGKTVRLNASVQPGNATDKSLTWTSSDTNIATVDATGLVAGLKPGTATITAKAKDGSGVSGSCPVTVKAPVVFVTGISVTPNPASVEQGKTVQLSAVVQPVTATNKGVTWISGDTSVATVDATGLVAGLKPGTATITATAQDSSGVNGSCQVTVKAPVVLVTSISVTPNPASVEQGKTLQLSALLQPDTATNKGVTWTSGDTSVATVDAAGLAAGLKPGTVTITATAKDGSGEKAQCGLTVYPKLPADFTFLDLGDAIRITGYTGSAAEVQVPGTIMDKPVTEIGKYAFTGKAGVTKVVLPASIRVIGDLAFEGCSGLTAIHLPEGLTDIGLRAFDGCSGLASITIPDSVSHLGARVFLDCSGLIQAKLPAKLTAIPERMFWYCTSLRNITLPGSITGIGDHSFAGCESLTSISLPSSLTSIGPSAFQGTGLTSITLPNGITSIGNSAFISCENLSSVTLPNKLTSIGTSAFGNCKSLASITIPESVTDIGESVFNNCQNLTQVKLPAKLTAIPARAFRKCWKLNSINIPAGITQIGDVAFSECYALPSFPIPKGVTKIGFATFWGCKSFTGLALPAGLTEIGRLAFKNCTGLTEVVVPGKVKTIADEAFYDCTSLKKITVRSNVSAFGGDVFKNSPVTIYGDVPSAAKTYADTQKIPFVDLAGRLPGDANNDGVVNIDDLSCVVDFLVKGTACPSMKNADANSSGGDPDVQDLIAIIHMIITP